MKSRRPVVPRRHASEEDEDEEEEYDEDEEDEDEDEEEDEEDDDDDDDDDDGGLPRLRRGSRGRGKRSLRGSSSSSGIQTWACGKGWPWTS
jgi:hypothetical protein